MTPPGPTRPAERFAVGDPAPDPLSLRTESEIVATWEGDEPVVSVLCSTFQHVDFVEDALRGILGQDTTFPFEVLVRDDASTDGTADIVADYAERYPSIVRAVLEPVNRWRRPGHVRLSDLARGRYLARCEGDDYWIDPVKLRTQVATLDEHPDVVLSHHQALVVEDESIVELARLPADKCRDYSPAELRRAPLTVGASRLFRRLPLDPHPQRTQILNADMLLVAQLGEHGSARWEPGLLPSVYRRHPGGVWSMRDPVQRGVDSARSYYWIGTYFLDRDPDAAHDLLARGLASYLRGVEAAGADPAALVAAQTSMLRRITGLPRHRLPAPLRRLVDQREKAVALRDAARRDRDAARRDRDAARRDRDSARQDRERLAHMYDRLRHRRSVRLALWIASILGRFRDQVRHMVKPGKT